MRWIETTSGKLAKIVPRKIGAVPWGNFDVGEDADEEIRTEGGALIARWEMMGWYEGSKAESGLR